MKKVLCLILAIIIVVGSIPLANAGSNTYKVGDIIQFGSYPQSRVTDNVTINALNSKAPNWNNWMNYGYYSGLSSVGSMIEGDWMRYIDIIYDGDKYRGVKFTSYRPYFTAHNGYNWYSYQDENGYSTNVVYWFKYEPINWRVLDPNTGFVMCETIIDAQPYSNTVYANGSGTYSYFNDAACTTYASDYETSSIRKWLNNDFYNIAFSKEEKLKIRKTLLNNDGYYTSNGTVGYEKLDGKVTEDNIFLLSITEARNSAYGLNSNDNARRETKGSDYAKSQGLYVFKGTNSPYTGNSTWILRTPGYTSQDCCCVSMTGAVGCQATDSTMDGVRPAMRINLNNLKNGNYKINLYSSMPAMTIGENTTVNFIAELQNDGETVYDDFEYSIVTSDPDVIEIKNLVEYPEGLFFDISSKKEGVARITLTETLSGAIYSTQIAVKDHIMTYNSSAMPVYRDFTEYYNGYVDGMYIDDYSCSDSEDENYCNMSFNVYNATYTIGAVEVYDSNGKLTDVYPIDRHNGKKVTGFVDIIWKWGALIFDDMFNGELLTFKQDSYATKTPIENIRVQKGGYVKISNSMVNSDSVAALNMVGYIISAVCFYKDIVSSVGDTVELYKNIDKSLITKIIGGDFNNFSDKMIDTYADIAGKEISIGAFNDVATTLINGGTKLLTQSGFNLAEIAVKSAASLGIDFAEDAFTKCLGGYGLIIDALFAWDEFMDLTSWTLDLTNYYENVFEIFLDTADSKLCNNGVTISKENGISDFSNSNFVMRSILITEDDVISNSSKEFLDVVADNYVVRDIYLEKDGAIVQPNETVIVSIPIPENYDASKCVVYWLKDDGTTELMQSTVFGGYIHFQTDHFSYYALVELHEHEYEVLEEVKENCTENGYIRYICKCNDTYTDIRTATGHCYNLVITPPTCTEQGYTTYTCECGYSYKGDYKNANGHSFNGSACSNCSYDKADSCSCNCHKSGISAIIWKIINFFNKLFKIKSKKMCACGIAHY